MGDVRKVRADEPAETPEPREIRYGDDDAFVEAARRIMQRDKRVMEELAK